MTTRVLRNIKKRIVAEVWFYWALRVSHTKPESRHFSVEAARAKAAQLNHGHDIGEPPYVVLVLCNGAFMPDKSDSALDELAQAAWRRRYAYLFDSEAAECPQCEGDDNACKYCNGVGRISENSAAEWFRQNEAERE